MLGIKLIRDTMLRQLTDPLGEGAGSTGGGGLDVQELQKYAFYFDMTPDDVAALDAKELMVLRRIMRNAETTGKDPREIKNYQDLLDGGLVTPSDLRKMLFGDTGSSGDGVGWANLALSKEKFEYDKQQDAQKTIEDRRQYEKTYDYNIKADAAKLGFNYDELNQREKSDLRTLAYDYFNSTNDANASRMQALSSLISNRNNAANDLASNSINAAKIGAEFAASPRDAYSDLLYQKAVGGPVPYGQTSGPNAPAFADYQSGLDAKFQQLFGGVAGDLSRVRGYLDQPIPSEYSTPIQAPQIDTQPQQYGPPQQLQQPQGGQFYGFDSPEEAQAMMQYFQKQGQLPGNAGGGSAMAGKMDAKQPMNGMMNADPGKQMMETHHITKTHPDGKHETHIINKSKPWEPKDSAPPQMMDVRGQMGQMRSNAAGGQQMLQEPVVGIGVESGRPLFTAAENGDELARFNPNGVEFVPQPGVPQQLDPRRQQQMVSSVMGNAAGGEYPLPPAFSVGGDMLKAYAAYNPKDVGAQWRAAAAGYQDAATSSGGGMAPGAITQYEQGPQSDPRYAPSTGTRYGQNPVGRASYIRDAQGNLTATANADPTAFQYGENGQVRQAPGSIIHEVINGRTVSRALPDAEAAGIAGEMRSKDIDYRTSRMRGSLRHFGPEAFWGNMSDYGSNMKNWPKNRAWEEYTTPSGARATAPVGSATQGLTSTGRYIVGYDGDTPIYGELDDRGSYQTDLSRAASGGRGYQGRGAPAQLSTRRSAGGGATSGGGGVGGTSTGTGATPDKLTKEIVTKLTAIDPQLVVQPGQSLPDPRLLSSPLVIAQLQTDSDLYDLIVAAYSKQGISEAKLKAILKQYGFVAPKNFQPSVKVA